MTTTFSKVDQILPAVANLPVQHLLLEDVSWSFYVRFLRETDEQQHLQITYDKGRMEIVSPSPGHERRKTILGSLIDIIALERDIQMCRLGSTTFRRKKLKKGLEPDECFYIANEARVRGKDRIDLRIDPPPDLVVEVDVTSRSIKREPVYAALGVPELWRHNGLDLTFRKLNPETKVYDLIGTSLAFPFLAPTDLNRFLNMLPSEPETRMLREFRDWIRQGV
jgi:Uma2 family endonuclease